MRTEEEILFSGDFNANLYASTQLGNIYKAINEAREETIIKCAGLVHPHWEHKKIREKILSLINELK